MAELLAALFSLCSALGTKVSGSRVKAVGHSTATDRESLYVHDRNYSAAKPPYFRPLCKKDEMERARTIVTHLLDVKGRLRRCTKVSGMLKLATMYEPLGPLTWYIHAVWSIDLWPQPGIATHSSGRTGSQHGHATQRGNMLR